MRRRLGDRELGYDDCGAGAPVVLLHPFPLDRRFWAATAAALAATNRVITVDARGFGESDLPGGAFSIADLAADVADLMDALGLPSAALGGLSMGGYAALAFAQRYPERLSALILANTRAAADSAETARARDEAIALIRSAGIDAYLDRSLPRLLAPDAPAQRLVEVRALAERRPDRVIAGLQALRDRPDRGAELAAVTCPTLVVAGAADQIIPVAEMQAMGDAISNARARFVSLNGAGHLAALEALERFNRALAEFLDDVKIR
jgi:3-oxoadipate enol-lactonase